MIELYIDGIKRMNKAIIALIQSLNRIQNAGKKHILKGKEIVKILKNR